MNTIYESSNAVLNAVLHYTKHIFSDIKERGFKLNVFLKVRVLAGNWSGPCAICVVNTDSKKIHIKPFTAKILSIPHYTKYIVKYETV